MATREDLDKAIEGVNGIMYGGRTLRAAESLPKEQLEKGEKRDFKNGTNGAFDYDMSLWSLRL